MRNHLMTMTLAGLVGLAATPAMAQNGTAPSRVEVGGNVVASSIGYGFLFGPEVAFNFAPRHAVQATADIGIDHYEHGSATQVLYTVQYRYSLPLNSTKIRVFVTAGLLGSLDWSHSEAYTYTSMPYTYTGINGQKVNVPATTYNLPAYSGFSWELPTYPTGGIAVQYRLAKRIAVQGGVSLTVSGDDDELYVFARAAVGVVVPLGRVK
jgi:hypothetical protein